MALGPDGLRHDSSVSDTVHHRIIQTMSNIMDMKAFEITTKLMVGEDVTDEEKSYARNYNAKYSIVRHLVMEKFAADKTKQVKNFHFTPGENFMETPTVDVVNSIIDVFSNMHNATPLDFGDSSWIVHNKYGNPPNTGRTKTKLGEQNDLLDTQKEF